MVLPATPAFADPVTDSGNDTSQIGRSRREA